MSLNAKYSQTKGLFQSEKVQIKKLHKYGQMLYFCVFSNIQTYCSDRQRLHEWPGLGRANKNASASSSMLGKWISTPTQLTLNYFIVYFDLNTVSTLLLDIHEKLLKLCKSLKAHCINALE